MFQEMLALFLPRSYNGDASDMGTMIIWGFNLNQKIIENMGVKGVEARLCSLTKYPGYRERVRHTRRARFIAATADVSASG